MRVYEPTERGAELEPIMRQFGRWGARSPAHRPDLPLSVASFVLSLRTNFDGGVPADLNAEYELRLGEDRFRARVVHGGFEVVHGAAQAPLAVIEGRPEAFASVIYGGRPLASAVDAADLVVEGDLDSWSSGRVTLVGDAGYCPAPVVGGGTALAVVGAYVLAGELAATGGDPATAFPSYERELDVLVRRSRDIGPTAMKTLIPHSPLEVWVTTQVVRLVPRLPATLQRKIFSFQIRPARALEAVRLKDYQPLA